MKLAEGTSFRTTMRFPGVLPVLPNVGDADKERMGGYLKEEVARQPPGDYRHLRGRQMAGKDGDADRPSPRQYGQDDAAKTLDGRLRKRLEEWFTRDGCGRHGRRIAACSTTTTAGAR